MSEQEKREAVIKEFKDNYRPYSPSYAHVLVRNWAIRDTIDLLKAQEPRVMTLEEAAEADYCYVEFQNGDIKPALIRCFDVGVFKLQLKDTYYLIGPDFVKLYGRFWTSSPTDEQRKAVKWE